MQYVLIKFLGARKESAERIGVLGVHFFGYEVKPNCPLNEDLHLVIIICSFVSLTEYILFNYFWSKVTKIYCSL